MTTWNNFKVRGITVSFAMGLVCSCGKGKDTNNSPSADEPAKKTTESVKDEGGVTDNDGKTVGVAGQLSLSLSLTADATPDKLLAVPIEGGNFSFTKDGAVTADIDENGKFSLDLPQQGTMARFVEQGLNADGTVNRDLVNTLVPQAKGASDAEIKNYITETKADRKLNPEKYEFSYVVLAYKASGDKVAEAESMVFFGMPTSGSPLLGLPITKAKGNLNFGSVKIDGETAVTSLKADSTSFDIDESTLAAMTTTNDALKTIKNIYINTDLATGSSVEITPAFDWKAPLSDLKAGASKPDGFKYDGYFSYIAPRGMNLSLADACAANESARLIFKVFPPEAQTNATSKIVYDKDNPISNLGALNSPLKAENGGDRQSCLVGSGYFAGDSKEGLYQINGLIAFPGIAPNGWWEMQKNDKPFATFDLGLSNPVAEDGHIKMFVPTVKMTLTAGNISKMTITFMVWDAEAKEYKELSDLGAFKRVVKEIGLSVSRYNENGGSSDVGASRPSTVEGNSFVVTEFKDGSDKKVDVADPSVEATKGSVFLYYQAFGNSYNFFWNP